MPASAPARQRRLYQEAVLAALAKRRFFVLLWRRQAGKSTTLAEAAMAAMLAQPGVTVVYASASLLLGREIVFKEAQLLYNIFRRIGEGMDVVDRRSGKAVTLTQDDLAEVFENQRMEFRVRHDATVVSRTQVIAPNPATARGWTGWVFLDEFGFIRDFRDLWEAVEPIISTDQSFHLVMATTPPKDDAHYSYELTAPPIGARWPVNPAGNWYESEARVAVHRVDILDAHAAGVKLFDMRSGRELTPEEHFAAADDKDAWRRNYMVEHILGGTSACGLLQLDTAQRRGLGQCALFEIDREEDMERACSFLRDHGGRAPTGLGMDLATTEKGSSNPTAVAVVEEHGHDFIVRAVLVWKSKDPVVHRRRVRALIASLLVGHESHRPRRLCVDATNERLFAADLRDDLRPLLPVELIVGSERMEILGQEPMSTKQALGGKLVSLLDSNVLTLPPERYLREDWRLVKKERGQFVCDPDNHGRHGDTFDAVKLGVHALRIDTATAPQLFPNTLRGQLFSERLSGSF